MTLTCEQLWLLGNAPAHYTYYVPTTPTIYSFHQRCTSQLHQSCTPYNKLLFMTPTSRYVLTTETTYNLHQLVLTTPSS